jgi:hypothetical protein
MRILSFGLVALLALPVLSACENGGTDPEDREPARVEVAGGNAQQGTAGQALAQPVRVRVVDDRGRPVPGQAVNFVVTGGGGTVSVGTVTTDDDGYAATQWTLGTSAAAAQTLEARVAGANGQAIVSGPITATVRAGLPAKLEPAVPARPQGGSVGGPTRDSLAVRVLDQHNNPVAGADVQWAATEGGGSVNPTRSATDANGIARAQWILGPNVNVVQGAVASVPGAGQVSFFARAANAIAPVQGHNITASGGTTITASVTLGGGNAGPVPGVKVQWTVLSGGGSVAPAESVSGEGPSLGIAGTQWTLGPGGGTQTLRATAGTLQTTLIVTVIQQGSRTLVAQVPGRALDALGDRVLWLDSAGGQRLFKIRMLSTGADVTVKTDTIRTSFTHVASGYLFNGGALLWSTAGNLFEHRAGTLADLGSYGGNGTISTDGKWAAWSDGATVFRRDLDAATTVTVGSGSGPDVGADGDVVFLNNSGGWLYSGGALTPVSVQSGTVQIATDGVNVVYVTLTNTFTTSTLWLDQPGGDVVLTGHSHGTGGAIYYRLAGGWIAYSTPLSPVSRRAPDGTVTQITTETTATRVEALAPDGTLIYHHPTPNGRYFLVTPAGVKSDVGPATTGERVVWRDGRFLLFSDGSVYQLAP